MDGSVERRGLGGARIPLDSHVELAHEGFTERFEADGVNVSAGGIAMRASYLPDVGSRLRCRFPGATGRVVEAGAEVVWSSDKGGEFGLRFLELDDEAQRALGTLLEKRRYLPPTPGESRTAESTMDEPVGPSPVSLAIDGVSSPIRAGVISEDDDVLTVAQELPFLRLKTGVTVQKDGRRGRIEGIDLLVDGETPRLLIDIVFDEMLADPAPAALVTDDATLPDFLPETPAATAGSDTAVDLSAPDDELVHDELEDDDEIENVLAAAAGVSAPRIVRVPSATKFVAPETSFVTPDPSTEPGLSPAEPGVEGTPGSIDEALAAHVAEPEPELQVESDAAIVVADPKARLVARLVTARDALKSRIGPIGPRIEGLKTRLGPTLVLLFGKLKTGWATFRAERLPKITSRVKSFSQTAITFVLRVRDKVGERIPAIARRSKKRRKTAPPPSDSNVAAKFRGRRRREAQKPQNKRRRTFMISAAAFVGVGLAVWALTPGDETVDAADPLAGHQPIGAATTAPATPLPPADPALTQSTPVETGAVNAPPVNLEPAMPRALGEASREAGPMPAPTFPSLREGARPQAPQALPEGSPYAVDVREGGAAAAPAPGEATPTEGALFGAPDVPGGRSYLMRMSQPVSVVRGTPRTDGFTVTIPNSLSLDRAGPIAASHPLVERSMILNRGDHSELTITFVEGQSPAYRVSARGSAIEVLIARR